MKTLTLFTLNEKAIQSTFAAVQEETLGQFMFSPCGLHDQVKRGFTANLDGLLVSDQKAGILLRVTEQKKAPEVYLLKAHVERQTVQFEAETGRKPKKEDKSKFKSIAMEELLPVTTPKEPKTYSMLLRPNGMVLCEASAKISEDMISLVRKALGSFAVVPMETDAPVGDLLDSLVKGVFNSQGNEVSDDYFEVLQKATLTDSDEGTITFAKRSLADTDARELVAEQGAMVNSLELLYDGLTAFVIRDDLSISGIKYSEDLIASLGETEDELDFALGSQALILEEVSKLVDEVLQRLKVV